MKKKILSWLKSHLVVIIIGVVAFLVPTICGLESWRWWIVSMSIAICSMGYPIQGFIDHDDDL